MDNVELSEDERNDRLEALGRIWKRNLSSARQKRKRFIDDYRRALAFYDGPHDDVFDNHDLADWDEFPKVTINKTFEFVEVVGPSTYHDNPTRIVTTQSPLAKKQAFAKVLETLLNWSPEEMGLREEAQQIAKQGFMSGRGCGWTILDKQTGAVTTEYVDIEDILLDPDARQAREIKWMARRRQEPIWEVARLYPDMAEELKEARSYRHGSIPDYEGEEIREEGVDEKTPEVTTQVVYWEIFSKMGNGFRSRDGKQEFREDALDDEDDYKYIVVAEEMKKPLHVGEWPAPLYLDRNGWFHTFLDFTWKPRNLWNFPYLKPAFGEQEAMDILFSIMLAKGINNSKELVGLDGSLDPEQKKKIISGGDREIVEFTSTNPAETLASKVGFLTPPPMSTDLKEMFRQAMELFEMRTGLGELLYGQTRNTMRSAREAEIKDRNSRGRIEHLAKQVEAFMRQCAKKEAIMWRFFGTPEEVERIIGPEEVFGWTLQVLYMGQPVPPEQAKQVAGGMFDDYFTTQEEAVAASMQIAQATMNPAAPMPMVQAVPVKVTAGMVWSEKSPEQERLYAEAIAAGLPEEEARQEADLVGVEEIAREYQIRIESGSAKRPDKNFQIDKAEMLQSTVGAVALQTGQLDKFNEVLDAIYEAYEFPPRRRIFLDMLPPPMPPGGAPGAPEEEAPPEEAGMSALPPMPGSEESMLP